MSRTYSIKEAFYTLQGEGAHAGLPAVFVRFSGCNLWSGRDSDRATAKGSCASWCDTDFVGTDGLNGGKYTAQDLADLVLRLWPANSKTRTRIVLTGGEPLLQVDHELVLAFLSHRCYIAIETNGTQPVPSGIDWICVSPKSGAPIALSHADELKIVWPQPLDPEAVLSSLAVTHCSIQPRADISNSIQDALAFVQAHPRWRLSLQLHKILCIP